MRLAHRIRRLHRQASARLRRLQVEPAADPYRDALTVARRWRSDQPAPAAPGSDTDLCRRLEWWR